MSNPYYISDANINLNDDQKTFLAMIIAVFGDGQGSTIPENVIHFSIEYVKDILINNDLINSLEKQDKKTQKMYYEIKEIFDKL